MTYSCIGTPFVYLLVNIIFKYNHHVNKKKQFDTTEFDE